MKYTVKERGTTIAIKGLEAIKNELTRTGEDFHTFENNILLYGDAQTMPQFVDENDWLVFIEFSGNYEVMDNNTFTAAYRITAEH
jgi:hypothetical protein